MIELAFISKDVLHSLLAKGPTLHGRSADVPLDVAKALPGDLVQVSMRPRSSIPTGVYEIRFTELDRERRQAEVRRQVEIKEARNPDWDNIDLEALSEELSRRPSAEELRQKSLQRELARYTDSLKAQRVHVLSRPQPHWQGDVSITPGSRTDAELSATMTLPLSTESPRLLFIEALGEDDAVMEARYLLTQKRRSVLTSGSCGESFSMLRTLNRLRIHIVGQDGVHVAQQTVMARLAYPEGERRCQ